MFGEGIQFYFPLTALINTVASTVVGVYIIFAGRKAKYSRDIFRFCFAVALWSGGYFLWQISDNAVDALFWSRVLMAGAILTALFYFHLVINFLQYRKKLFYKTILIAFYVISGVWLLLDCTSFFVSGIEPRLMFEFWPTPGPFYLPFLVTFTFEFLYATWLLIRGYRISSGNRKMQFRLLTIGGLIGFVGGSTNYLLWYNIPIAPWGNGLVVVYFVLTVYAIMKYGLLNLRVVTAEMFTLALMSISLVDVFLSETPAEFVLSIVILFFMVLFGAMLVSSVRKEVGRAEELTKLATSLENANYRLQELDRQKTEFLSIASHQLRTPLSIIKGYIELISDGAYGKAPKKMKQVLTDMDESNERLVKLVDEFLDITRIEQGRTKFSFDTHSMEDLITSVVDELRDRGADKGVKVVWKLKKTGEKNVYMDDEKVRHVVFNYVDNAIKYTSKGSVKVTYEIENKGMVVRVKDNGIGFDKEDEANFFQKFYRGKNVKGTNVNGTGLGIYVCRKFIEAHGGRVWAKSEGKGKGGEFGFWLPLKKGAAPTVMQQDATSADPEDSRVVSL
jgi:signal transduction histidine kinase